MTIFHSWKIYVEHWNWKFFILTLNITLLWRCFRCPGEIPPEILEIFDLQVISGGHFDARITPYPHVTFSPISEPGVKMGVLWKPVVDFQRTFKVKSRITTWCLPDNLNNFYRYLDKLWIHQNRDTYCFKKIYLTLQIWKNKSVYALVTTADAQLVKLEKFASMYPYMIIDGMAVVHFELMCYHRSVISIALFWSFKF